MTLIRKCRHIPVAAAAALFQGDRKTMKMTRDELLVYDEHSGRANHLLVLRTEKDQEEIGHLMDKKLLLISSASKPGRIRSEVNMMKHYGSQVGSFQFNSFLKLKTILFYLVCFSLFCADILIDAAPVSGSKVSLVSGNPSHFFSAC